MENLSPGEFLDKVLVDPEFCNQIAGYMDHTLPMNKTQMSRELAEAGRKMGYDFTTGQIEDGFSRLWLTKSMWIATEVRIKINRAIKKRLRGNSGTLKTEETAKA